jgi:hypothetical protein
MSHGSYSAARGHANVYSSKGRFNAIWLALTCLSYCHSILERRFDELEHRLCGTVALTCLSYERPQS